MSVIAVLHLFLFLLSGYLGVRYFNENHWMGFLWMGASAVWLWTALYEIKGVP